MANNKTNYLENAIINHIIRGVPFTTPGDEIFVALYTVTPGEAGGGTEVAGGAYARVQVSGTTAWNAPVDGLVDNVAAILYATATAAWGTVVAVALLDAITAGNMLYYGALTTPRDVAINDQFRFPAGDLDISEL